MQEVRFGEVRFGEVRFMWAYRDVRVASIALGVGSGEDSVDEDEGADDLSCKTRAQAVSRGYRVRSSAILHVERVLESFH